MAPQLLVVAQLQHSNSPNACLDISASKITCLGLQLTWIEVVSCADDELWWLALGNGSHQLRCAPLIFIAFSTPIANLQCNIQVSTS